MKIFKRFRSQSTIEQKTERRRDLLLCALSGILLGVSFPPLPFPFLSFFALIPFLYVLEKKESLASINRFTYFTLFFFNIITLYWVGSWTKEADSFLMISGAALILFSPFFYLIVTTLYYFSRKTFGKNISLFMFPFYWVTFEYLYSLTDIRFPWLTLGNCLPYFNDMIQIADIIGVYGLSLVILFINVFFYMSFRNYKSTKTISYGYTLTAVLIFAVVYIYGIIRISGFSETQNKIKVGLIQPNLNPWEKWQLGSLNKQIDSYLELSQKAIDNGADVIVWPESALPVYFLSGNYDNQVQRIQRFVNTKKVSLLTGMPDATFYFDAKDVPQEAKKTKSGIAYTSYNSILHFSPYQTKIEKYGKIKLVPFGEHVPFVEELPFLGDFIKWQVGISSWNVGKNQVVFNLDEPNEAQLRAAGVICIESIYPDFVAGFVQKGANLIVVVTNDSWYGYSSGPFQHKEIAVLRAVENRKSVVRAANGGISCVIDPLGKITSQTELFTKTFLVDDAEINLGLTFYTEHPLIIPLSASIVSILTFLLFMYKKIITIKPKKAQWKNIST
jgi:apolipoprotein N-acyltransferase